MGAVKQYELEKNSERIFECPMCFDIIPCSEEDYEVYEFMGCCQACEHMWNKRD